MSEKTEEGKGERGVGGDRLVRDVFIRLRRFCVPLIITGGWHVEGRRSMKKRKEG